MAQRSKIPVKRKMMMVNPGVYGYQLPGEREFNGELLNPFGNPVTRDGETRHEYNVRVAMWRRTHGKPVVPKTIPNLMETNEAREEHERLMRRWMDNQKRGGIIDISEPEDYTPDYVTLEERKKKKSAKSKTKRKSTKKKGCGCK
jgi:hypothetical protein